MRYQESRPRGAGNADAAEYLDHAEFIAYLGLPQRDAELLRLELAAGGERRRFAESFIDGRRNQPVRAAELRRILDDVHPGKSPTHTPDADERRAIPIRVARLGRAVTRGR